jgi:hypothetical protein
MEQQHANGAVMLERRFRDLENDRDRLKERLADVQTEQRRMGVHDKAITQMAAAQKWMLTDMKTVRETVSKMQAEQHRLVLGTALALGGVLLQVVSFGIQALRVKLGF